METLFGALLALATLGAAAYVHRKIVAFTNSRGKILFSRVILIAVGIAFGAISSLYVAGTPQKFITFLAAFGVVHVPAAIILLVKTKRGERRS